MVLLGQGGWKIEEHSRLRHAESTTVNIELDIDRSVRNRKMRMCLCVYMCVCVCVCLHRLKFGVEHRFVERPLELLPERRCQASLGLHVILLLLLVLVPWSDQRE